jgi:hypothetical protein
MLVVMVVIVHMVVVMVMMIVVMDLQATAGVCPMNPPGA